LIIPMVQRLFRRQSLVGWIVQGTLLIGATGRLSSALLVAVCLLWTGALASLLLSLTAPLMPQGKDRFPRILVVISVAYAFERLCMVLFPVSADENLLFFAMVPLVLLSERSFAHPPASRLVEAATGGLRDSAFMALPLLVMALIRELIGYGVLTVPGPLGLITFLDLGGDGSWPLALFSRPAGGFILLALLLGASRYLRALIEGLLSRTKEEG